MVLNDYILYPAVTKHTYLAEWITVNYFNLHRNKNNFLYSDVVISFASGHSYLSDYLADQQPKPSALN